MTPSRGWGASWAPALLLGLGASALLWPSLTWVWEIWWTQGWFVEYSFGPVGLLAAGVLVWRARPWEGGRPALWGWAAIGAALFGGVAAQAQGFDTVAAASLLVVAAGIVWRLAGPRSAVRLLPALLALALVIPVQGEVQVAAAAARGVAHLSTALAQLGGVPLILNVQTYAVQPEGVVLDLETVTLSDGSVYAFEPACGGLQKIRALLLLSAVSWGFAARPWRRSLLLLLLAPAAAYAGKVLDVSTLLVITPALGQDQALAAYHGWFSYLTFAAAIAGLHIAARGRG